MAEKSTFIKIDRNITEWGWYHDTNTKVVFLHLIIKANIKEHKFENIVVHRSELVTSYPSLAKDLGLSIQNVRTALKHLESTGEITVTKYSKFSLISVKNYDKYQSTNSQVTGDQQSTNSQVTGDQQSTNSQVTTIKECKEYKNEKNGKNERNISGASAPEPPPGEIVEKKKPKSDNAKLQELINSYSGNQEIRNALSDFVKMRTKIKKPLTERALKSALKKLDELSQNQDAQKIMLIDQSVEHCWHTFYPIKNQQNQFYQNQNQFPQQQPELSPEDEEFLKAFRRN